METKLIQYLERTSPETNKTERYGVIIANREMLEDKPIVKIGWSFCNRHDSFRKLLGRKIAEGRATKRSTLNITEWFTVDQIKNMKSGDPITYLKLKHILFKRKNMGKYINRSFLERVQTYFKVDENNIYISKTSQIKTILTNK